MAQRISSDSVAELMPLAAIDGWKSARLRQCPSAAPEAEEYRHLRGSPPAVPPLSRRFHIRRVKVLSAAIFIGVITEHAFIDITNFMAGKEKTMPG